MAEKLPVVIPKRLVIKGEVRCAHDVVIEGQVDGNVNLDENSLLVGPEADIHADIYAKSVTILGKVHGNVVATDNVGIAKKGELHGDVFAPKIAINEGACFQGKMNMGSASAPIGVARPARTAQNAAAQKPSVHH